ETASAGPLATQTVYCKASSLPLDSPNAVGGIHLSPNSFLGITREYSTASFELMSLSSQSIDRVVVIVEYLDTSDKVVLRIPFYATSTRENVAQPPFALPLAQFLDKAIELRDRVVLVGDSPLVSLVCPVKARVIFESVGLSNGKLESFS